MSRQFKPTNAERKKSWKVPKGSRSGLGSVVGRKGSTSREVSSGYSARSFEVRTFERRDIDRDFQIVNSSGIADRYTEI